MHGMQETGVQPLGQEDPPEKEMAIHSAILFSHGQRSLACCSPWGHTEWDTIERVSMKESYMHMKSCWHQAKFQLTSMQILTHLVLNELPGEIIFITFYFYNNRMGKPNIIKHEDRMERIDTYSKTIGIVLPIKIKWFC